MNDKKLEVIRIATMQIADSVGVTDCHAVSSLRVSFRSDGSVYVNANVRVSRYISAREEN